MSAASAVEVCRKRGGLNVGACRIRPIEPPLFLFRVQFSGGVMVRFVLFFVLAILGLFMLTDTMSAGQRRQGRVSVRQERRAGRRCGASVYVPQAEMYPQSITSACCPGGCPNGQCSQVTAEPSQFDCKNGRCYLRKSAVTPVLVNSPKVELPRVVVVE